MKKILIAIAIASSFPMTTPLYAQENQTSGAQNNQSSGTQGQGQQSSNRAMKDRRAVIGEAVETREIQPKGVNTKHRLVKMKNKEGPNLALNVGDATRMQAGQFKKGSRLIALGKETRINGKPVLYAKYLGDLREAGSLSKQARRK